MSLSRVASYVLPCVWCLVFLAGAQSALLGQGSGSITGRVVNSASGLGVPNATVSVVGGAGTAETDLNGLFTLEGVPAGQTELAVTKDGFQSSNITDVSVTGGQATRLDLPLTPQQDNVVRLEAFKVSADIVQGSDIGLLASRQRAAAVSDAIGSDQFGRLAVGDAAEALSKVTGASLVDGKYVLIRGLGDRYSNTLMNGISVPSADPDKRAVQMDQFPSDLIDSIVTTKSFTPDQPGAFSGGSVNLKTKAFPDNFFVSFSVSAEYNDNATGKDLLTVENNGSGAPALPATIPSRTEAEIAARQGNLTPAQELDRAVKAFGNGNPFPRTEKADPNYGFTAAFGNRHLFGEDGLFGYTASFTFDRDFTHDESAEANRFIGTASAPQPRLLLTRDRSLLSFAPSSAPTTTPPFGVTSSSEVETLGGFVKLSVRPVSNHEASLDLFYNESTDNAVRRGVGEEAINYIGSIFEVYDLLYTERTVSSAQLSGKSLFEQANLLEVEWRLAYSSSTQDQPDYRTLASVYSLEGAWVNATSVQPNRYFRELEEDAVEGAVDITYPFSAQDREHRLKVGGVYSNNERSYDEQRFQYTVNPRSRDELVNFPGAVGILAQTPTSVTLGNSIVRLQEPNNYEATQDVSALYAMVDYQTTDRLRAILGVRFEQTEIETTPVRIPGLTPRDGVIDQTDALPALNLVYALNSKMNVRAAYGRTLARPTYKELTDIRYEDVFTSDVYLGNPDLELTLIDNVDLRWEWFPRPGETLAVSAFYKKMDRPIEVLYEPSIGSIQPQNVDEGTVYGIEFEFRRSLGFIGESFDAFSVGTNLTFIHSEVTIPSAELAILRSFDPGADDKRELLGQSPYVFNADVTYDHQRTNTSATLSYNVVGERLDLVNFGPLPDVYEQPAPLLNLVVSQRLTDRWRLKVSAKNLLDPDREKTVGLQNSTLLWERSRAGRSYAVSLTYLFE